MTQTQALEILKSGENVFLTGSAGTGKTYVLNQYISYLKERKIRVAVTASTGIAATHMNGMTIHSWCGMGIKDNLTQADLRSLRGKQYLRKSLTHAKVLIIDEISMLHRNQLDLVNQILKYFNQTKEAFGGIQVVFAGDFFQLPPVGSTPISQRFSFMSPAWVEANLKVCYLTEQYRQNDNLLNRILNEIRNGKISQYSIELLRQSSSTSLHSNIEPTKLYTHNVDVDRINSVELTKLRGKERIFRATTKGNIKIIETFVKSVQAPEIVRLKIGAKVMFVKNNPEQGYINGSMGKIVDFVNGYPMVRLISGKTILAKTENWSVQDDLGKSLAKYEQVPLRLAWAITIHKSQGMTLDAAKIDLTKTFERGQGYVALSRLKALENLKLLGFNSTALEVEPLALKADKRFRELSTKVMSHFSNSTELKEKAKKFIIWCDGLTHPDDIKKQKEILERKLQKKSTYDQTKQLIEQGLSIEKIAKERGLNKGTIINHLIKLHSLYPNFDISRLKPPEELIEEVRIARSAVAKEKKKEEPFSLSSIRSRLKNKYGFDEIKLALIFC